MGNVAVVRLGSGSMWNIAGPARIRSMWNTAGGSDPLFHVEHRRRSGSDALKCSMWNIADGSGSAPKCSMWNIGGGSGSDAPKCSMWNIAGAQAADAPKCSMWNIEFRLRTPRSVPCGTSQAARQPSWREQAGKSGS
jgi:hypothetical protein